MIRVLHNTISGIVFTSAYVLDHEFNQGNLVKNSQTPSNEIMVVKNLFSIQ